MSAVAEKRSYSVEQDVASSVQLRYYSVSQVAQIFGKCQDTIYRGCRAGSIPSRRVGGSLLIPRQWVDEQAREYVNG